jgi:hypothetical protein
MTIKYHGAAWTRSLAASSGARSRVSGSRRASAHSQRAAAIRDSLRFGCVLSLAGWFAAGCSSGPETEILADPSISRETPDLQGAANATESEPAPSAEALLAPRPTVAWQYRGKPQAAARIAGCKDGSIYALNDDKTIHRNVSGGIDTGWVMVGTAALAQDIQCADRLWAFNTDRSIHRNDGTPTSLSWTRVGRPTAAKMISVGAIGNNAIGLYALNDDNSLWRSPTGADGSWTRIGMPSGAARVNGGGRDLWALNTNKTLYRGNGSDADWRYLDTPGSAAIISDDGSVFAGALWALNTDRTLYRGIVNGGAHGEVCRPNCYGTVVQNVICDRCDTGLACNASTLCETAGSYGQLCGERELINPPPVCYAPLTCQSGRCYGTGKLNEICRAGRQCDDGLICNSGNICTSGKAQTNCPAGSRDCNSCATGVASQFSGIFYGANASTEHAWKFNYFDTFQPINTTPDVLDSNPAEHFQSFVRTNDTALPFAATHSAPSGPGVLGIIKQNPTQKRLGFLHRTQNGHPAGMQALGQFLLYGDGTFVRVLDMTKAGTAQTTYIPDISEEAGDGLGAVKLANGDTLVVVGPENGSKSTTYRMFVTPGSLASPARATELGRVTTTWANVIKNAPNGLSNPLISENLSVISECSTGDIYIVNSAGDGGVPNVGIWRLSRVRFTPSGPVVEAVNHAFVDQSFRCHLRSSGTVWTDGNARLHFYCHERAVARQISEVSESVFFAQREMGPTRPPTTPPGAPCCERDADGECTLYPPPAGECP